MLLQAFAGLVGDLDRECRAVGRNLATVFGGCRFGPMRGGFSGSNDPSDLAENIESWVKTLPPSLIPVAEPFSLALIM